MIRCPGCGSPNPFGTVYCGACGSPLPTACPNCGASLEPGARFCGNCGAQLGGSPAGQQQGGWGQSTFPQQGNYNPQAGWGQQPQQGWNQQPQQQPQQPPYQSQQPYQQGGWNQQPQQPPYQPQQQFQQQGGWSDQPQQGAWGAQPGGMEYSGGWGAQPQQRSSTGLVILLVVLLIALGGFAYWAFVLSSFGGGSGGGTSGGGTAKISEGPFVSAKTDETSETRDVTITFKSNESSKAKISYGTTTDYGSFTDLEPSMVTDHSIKITGLTPDTSYQYQVYLRDKNNKDAYSVNFSFRTPK
jgi:hypothetical protein